MFFHHYLPLFFKLWQKYVKESITEPTYLGMTEKESMLKLIIPAIGEFLSFPSRYINLSSVSTQYRSDQPPKNEGEILYKIPLKISVEF